MFQEDEFTVWNGLQMPLLQMLNNNVFPFFPTVKCLHINGAKLHSLRQESVLAPWWRSTKPTPCHLPDSLTNRLLG